MNPWGRPGDTQSLPYVEKYNEEICFMVEIDNTCMEAIEQRVNFIELMGYEMSVELIEGYVQIILLQARVFITIKF